MKLSVIVPVYKVEAYLPTCIDSILAQSFKDFELILVYDGSPDRCPEICDKYACKDSRIRVIHKANGGLSDARNAGLDIARGEYIGFVDSDDYIGPDMYKCLIELVEKYNADIAATGYINITQHGEVLSRSFRPQQDMVLHREDFIDNFFPNNKWIIAAPVWNKIYRKAVFADLRFPVGKVYEDSFLQLPILDRCETVVISSRHDYYYLVQRQGSIMNAAFSENSFLNMDFCLEQYSYFLRSGNKRQQSYALDTYLGKYFMCYFGVRMLNPKLRNAFLPYKKDFTRRLFAVLRSPCTCEMRKLIAVMLHVNFALAYRLTRKYFPENLPGTLR